MSTEAQVKTKTKKKLAPPKSFKVIMMNDDVTSFEFVIFVLVNVFAKTQEMAEILAMTIHEKGSATIGIYSHDIAKTKVTEADSLAHKYHFPLKCRIEEEGS